MHSPLRSVISDTFWLYLFPALAILMPWSWYFRLCLRMVDARHPYRAAMENELNFARRILPDLDEAGFRRDYALTKLVDAADFYLCLTRGHRWFRRYVRRTGSWPAGGKPALLLGSHWGVGQWIWPDLRRGKQSAWFLARQSSSADFGRGRLAAWYGRLRGWGLRRAGARGVITIGGARNRIAATFAGGESLVALNDVPAPPGRPHAMVELLDLPVRLATGVIELALAHQAEISWFAMEIDPADGRRTLHIESWSAADAPAICSAFAERIDALIRRRPGCWQLWAIAPELLGTEASDDRARRQQSQAFPQAI